MALSIPPGYYDQLARVESNSNPKARASSSSASGLYQFTKSTWQGLGLAWKDVFDVDKQNTAIRTLTTQNATQLLASGINPDAGSLYAAHFLGAGKASSLYSADPSSPIGRFVSAAQIAANPGVFKGIKTVGDFKDWASRKMGNINVSSSGGASVVAQVAGVASDAAKVAILAAGGNTSGAIAYAAGSDTASNAADAVSGAVGDAVSDNPLSQFFDWLKELFSANTAARAAAIIVGIILVGIAIVALTGTDKVIVEAAKSTAKVAALAA